MGGRGASFRQPERRAEISTLRICIAKIRGGQFVTSCAFANGSRESRRVIRDGFSGFSGRTDWINVSLSCGAETCDSLELRGGYVWLPAPAGEPGNSSLLVQRETKRGTHS